MNASVPFISLVLTSAAAGQIQWTATRLQDPSGAGSLVYATNSTQQGGAIAGPGPGGGWHPGVWTSGGFEYLSPTDVGFVSGILGNTQVGVLNDHAAMWHGSAPTHVDLHPTGAMTSGAFAITADSQVGYATFGGAASSHAMLWHGDAASAVDLNPPGASTSVAHAAYGQQQGGTARIDGQDHAALWSGTAGSVLDLNAFAEHQSAINGMGPGQQVGWTEGPTYFRHAALWSGSAASRIDLHPFLNGFGDSILNATTGSIQVGECTVPGSNDLPHAGIWFGTAASFLDLHQFLPVGSLSSSASAVFQHGDTIYVAGNVNITEAVAEAWLWTGTIPAPGTVSLFTLASVLAARRRR